MGKINGCLKAVFISFNALFTVLGSLIIYGLIKTLGMELKMEGMDGPSMIWVWVFAIAMLGISLLGSHSARTENKCCLKIFAVFMGIGMVITLIFGFAVVVLKNKAKEGIQSIEVAKEFMKNAKTRADLESLQEHLQCCGWIGVEDWEGNIPHSCPCTYSYGSRGYAECKPMPKSCSEAVWDYVEFGVKITMGILFGFSFIAMMGLIIAVNMIKQITRHDSVGLQAFTMSAY